VIEKRSLTKAEKTKKVLDSQLNALYLTNRLVKLNSWLTMTTHAKTARKAQTHRAPYSTREKILDAALNEFSRYGLAGARVDRIAHRAKINKAMIYYHFSSKKKLHQETIHHHLSTFLKHVHQAVSEAERFEDMLQKLVDIYAMTFLAKPALARILLREMADSPSKSINMLAKAISGSGLPDQLLRSFRDGIREGRLRRVDTHQALVSLVVMNIGYFILSPLVDKIWKISDRRRFIAKRSQAVIDLFLHGVELP